MYVFYLWYVWLPYQYITLHIALSVMTFTEKLIEEFVY
jgi:hypothetical protein